VLAVADRITVLRNGRVVLSAPRPEVDAARLAAAIFGEAPHDEAAPAAAAPSRGAPLLVAEALAGDRFGPLDLAVSAGECFGIFGVDGHGQTELLETLVGLRRKSGGRLELPAHGVAFVSGDRQESGLALDLPLAENLALRRELLPRATFRRSALAAAAAPLLAEFDVRSEGPWQPARLLSGGNQQKVVLARELSIGPELVLAENPTRGLDQQATAFVRARLRAVSQRGAALLVASTDLDEVVAIADRIAVIHKGRLHPCERSRAAAAAALAAAAAGAKT
jgi:general nucleoside transport system ATP-binding protein